MFFRPLLVRKFEKSPETAVTFVIKEITILKLKMSLSDYFLLKNSVNLSALLCK